MKAVASHGKDMGRGISISPGLGIEAEGPRLTNASTSGDTTPGPTPPTTGRQHKTAKRPGHGHAEQSVHTGGRVRPSGSKQVHEVAVGKMCLPTTAKPHSGDTTVEGSSGTRRTSDPVEKGLRRAHEDKATRRADPEGGPRAPGVAPWTDAGAARTGKPDGAAAGARPEGEMDGHWDVHRTEAACAEPGEVRTAPGPGALRAAPSGNVQKKADALCSSARLQSAGWAAVPVLIHIWGACLGNRLRLRLWPAQGRGWGARGISQRAKIWGHLQRTRLPTRWFPGPGSPPPAAGEMPAFPEVTGAERLPLRTPPADGSKQSM